MDLKEYLRILLRHRWVVLAVFASAVAVAGIGSWLQSSVYTAAATVRIAYSTSGSSDYVAQAYAERLMNTYVEILRSRPLMQEVISRLDLGISSEDLARQIQVEALANTELIRVTVEDPSGARAKGIANALVALLVEEGQQLYSGGAKTTRQILQGQLDEVERGLEQDTATLQALLQDPLVDGEAVDSLGARIELQREIYADVLRKYEEARLVEATAANSVTISEPAVEPNGPSSPRVGLNIALAAAVGLIGGVGLAFLFEHLQPTLEPNADLVSAAEPAQRVGFAAPMQSGKTGYDHVTG